jgi:putative ABC transport system permease protein
MNSQIIIAGLRARPVRTIVSILAVTLEVILILVIVGLTTGIANETAKRTAGVGAEIMVQPPNSSLFLALSNTPMPRSLGDEIRKLPSVQAVAPVQVQVNSSDGVEVVFGVDPASFNAVSGGFIWHEGRMFEAADEIVVDDLWAKARRANVGQQVQLLNHAFKVTGIVEHGKGARVFMSFDAVKELTGQSDKASLFYVKLKSPDQTKQALAEINRLLPGYTVRDVKDLESLMTTSNIPGLGAFINAVLIISLCVGVLVIFLSMYTTITERTREIGILRSLGASKLFIIRLIFEESGFICLIGIVVGIISSFVIRNVLTGVFPTLVVDITWDWILRGSLFALLSGLIGSFYPSVKAAAQDPVEALAYE